MTIHRTWSARATATNADRYVSFFEMTLTPELRRIEGFEGALVSTQPPGATGAAPVTIDVCTMWSSMQAIALFAGATPERAVVEPEAQALLTSYDEQVVHRAQRLRV